ncbi:putative exonuclease GOR isoform X1 [Coccinella septempunctata]|uniref:putative exonuclease GOR isoform X1 n=1 Tax=Coccinella septempunctata TaxID=41139 RepID=UPI001D0963AA|nr:putative exonuclease GOR isoform X1 [Coccinella septempunctata]
MEGIVETLLNPSVLIGLFVGVFISILCYFVLSSKTVKVVEKTSKKKPEVKIPKNPPHQPKPKQKPSNKKICHSSYASSFKGHAGNVTDADLSSNGKFLATCSDDDPGSTSTEDSGGSFCSSSDSNKANILSNSTGEKKRKASRRQTRNRRKMVSNKLNEQKKAVKSNDTNNNCTKELRSVLPAFGLTEDQLYTLLIDFTLMPDQLFTNGYPELNKAKNQVRILRQCFAKPRRIYERKKCMSYTDSDQNSNSSDSCEDNELGKSSLHSLPISRGSAGVERTCVRCSTGFFITDHEYLTKERCRYHWGKVIHSFFTCCKKPCDSVGCTSSKLHVWNGTVAGINEPLEGFVNTKHSKKEKKRKVYALDCEMCYTVKGLELCKVTILAYNGAIVYDHFVKPDNEVVDYNTRYSGVTESDVNGPNSKTFSKVQSDILELVTEDTILIGHGLDNDLRVLKLLHSNVVDTSLIFPHERGYPFRYSLKHLMSMYLQKQIQTSELGHSPYEDALSCLELIFFKVKTHHGQKYFNLIQKNSCS